MYSNERTRPIGNGGIAALRSVRKHLPYAELIGYLMNRKLSDTLPLKDIAYLRQVYRNAHGCKPAQLMR